MYTTGSFVETSRNASSDQEISNLGKWWNTPLILRDAETAVEAAAEALSTSRMALLVLEWLGTGWARRKPHADWQPGNWGEGIVKQVLAFLSCNS